MFATNASSALRIPASTGISVDTNGVLQSAGTGINSVAIGAGEARDVAGDDDIVLGRHVGNNVKFRGANINIPFNGGAAYLVHSGFTGQLPVTGSINYDIYAATQPVFASGSVAPGVFDADLTIGFGSNLKVGINGTVTMPEASGAVVYSFATPNRASGALVPLSLDFNKELSFSTALAGSGAACTSGTCSIFFLGGFAGDGPGDKVGFIYQTADENNFNTAEVIQGSVAFRAANTVASGAAKTAASIAPSVVPISSIDMTRWGGNGSGAGQGAGTGTLGLMPPGSTPGAAGAGGAMGSSEAAIRQAEQLLGGAITFAQPGGDVRAK